MKFTNAIKFFDITQNIKNNLCLCNTLGAHTCKHWFINFSGFGMYVTKVAEQNCTVLWADQYGVAYVRIYTSMMIKLSIFPIYFLGIHALLQLCMFVPRYQNLYIIFCRTFSYWFTALDSSPFLCNSYLPAKYFRLFITFHHFFVLLAV